MSNEATYNKLGDGFDQLSSADQAAVTGTVTATVTTTALAADVVLLTTLANRLRADLVSLKAIKGAA